MRLIAGHVHPLERVLEVEAVVVLVVEVVHLPVRVKSEAVRPRRHKLLLFAVVRAVEVPLANVAGVVLVIVQHVPDGVGVGHRA
jgi:hypothetical protein